MNKPTLYILTGMAFSGKSTLAKAIAKHTGAIVISTDLVWFEHQEEIKHLDETTGWKKILRISKEVIKENLGRGKSVVFDDVSIDCKYRKKLHQLAKDNGAHTIVVYLNTPEDLLTKRQKDNKISGERHDPLQRHIDDVKNKFEAPSTDENVMEFTPNTNLDEWLKRLE